ncbi:MAG: hypothetical protein IKH36_02905 [Bacilli bacterium]|nr:hypothetical protein [Bacilli bacterium]MBR4672043.1 hypothetical protein [Bacilli bacterium]
MENNENVTNEVVEQKTVAKKNNTPLIIMAIAVLLILAGVVLIVTGNNNSLIGKKEKAEKQEEPAKRNVVPVDLTDEEAIEVVIKAKAEKYAEEAWTLGEVHVIARGENGTFLILFDKVYETNTETLQTVITYGTEKWDVDLTGWPEGSKDLSEYNFKYYTDEPVEEPPVEEPAEQPAEPPVEEPPVEEPTIVIEPTEQPQAE